MLKFAMSQRVLALLALALPALALLAPAARANEACEACRADEQQIGDYVEPALPVPPAAGKPDPRGKPVKVPLPGGPATVHVKPGAGLWIGSPGEYMGDIFVKGSREKASVGWRLGF